MWVVQLKEAFFECEELDTSGDYFILKGFQWHTSKVDVYLKNKPKLIKIRKELVAAYFEIPK